MINLAELDQNFTCKICDNFVWQLKCCNLVQIIYHIQLDIDYNYEPLLVMREPFISPSSTLSVFLPSLSLSLLFSFSCWRQQVTTGKAFSGAAFFSALGNGNKRTARNYVDFYRRASFSAYKVHNFHSRRKPAEAAKREREGSERVAGHVGKVSVGWAAKDKRERAEEGVGLWSRSALKDNHGNKTEVCPEEILVVRSAVSRW